MHPNHHRSNIRPRGVGKSVADRDAVRKLTGILFTGVIALLGYGVSALPGLNRLAPLACAILLAAVYRQLFGYPEPLREGIQFAARKLLRFGIVLFGLKLNIDVVLHQGLGLLVRDAGTIVAAIGLTLVLAKWLKADASLSLLLGIGTGVCGAAAIAAVSPILRARDEDTAAGAGMIALLGTGFAVGYTLLRPWLPIDNAAYGLWSGVSLHEIAHVALAAAPAGQDALAVGLLAKLGRVFLLLPLSLLLLVVMKRKGKTAGERRVEMPWFLAGFLVMSLLGSYVLGSRIVLPESWMNGFSALASFLLTMAMVGLGLCVDFRLLRAKALRPFAVLTVVSILLSVGTYGAL
ncbi:YeiH family protein [Paenibacillus cymbidii]|uniref:YeiH family protein n=1 Tax=Paenibacillus cymbidii TaxID=1639034 RepID=UPI00107FFAAE|nr:putative sulfate exporter family transporter [Paenibacillus cymbidii]